MLCSRAHGTCTCLVLLHGADISTRGIGHGSRVGRRISLERGRLLNHRMAAAEAVLYQYFIFRCAPAVPLEIIPTYCWGRTAFAQSRENERALLKNRTFSVAAS